MSIAPTRQPRDRTRPFYRFVLVACARMETDYIQEWLQYHLSIGFDHIFVYCNDDNPDALYEKVLPFAGRVTFIYYIYQGLQSQMYLHFIRQYSANCQWVMFLDIDEFLFLPGSNNQLESFLDLMSPSVDVFYFNWLAFGNNGHKKRAAGSVLLNHTRREEHVSPFTKVLARSDKIPYQSFFENPSHPLHHDYTLIDANLKVANVFGEDYSGYYDNFPEYAWRFIDHGDRKYRYIETAFVAHYQLKSEEDFERRVRRGTLGDFGPQSIYGEVGAEQRLMTHEWQNRVYDDRLARYWQTYISRGADLSVFPAAGTPLISARKFASQSSTAHPWSCIEDAARLLDGDHSPASHNHSALEANPWWQVDLGKVYLVNEVRLFNRLDEPERMNRFLVEKAIYGNEDDWSVLIKKEDDFVFGGVETSPYFGRFMPSEMRYLRITIPSKSCFFHLRQVEIFGVVAALPEQNSSAC